MHNGLEDKRRRRINLRDRRVEEVLPEHFAADYPKFISLLESYYEFEKSFCALYPLNEMIPFKAT